MSFAALTSGGKDSILACQHAIDSGKEVEFLVTVRSKNRDSYMFHSANIDAVPVIARHAGDITSVEILESHPPESSIYFEVYLPVPPDALVAEMAERVMTSPASDLFEIGPVVHG